MIPILTGLILGFLILGPLGSIIGVLIAGFLMLRPPKVRNVIEGHSRGCGCGRCLRR